MRLIFFPISRLYAAIMSLRNLLFDWQIFRSWRAPLPVLAVGNISAGGTGKTPFVDWIVKFYHGMGIRVAIVSRGYKRKSKGTLIVSEGAGKPCVSSAEAGDEPFMLAMKNPFAMVVVSEKRKDGIEKLLALPKNLQPQLIILDDAFQHRQVHRDLNFLVIHAAKSPFKDAVLPLGRLRESVSGICRADMILISKIQSKKNVDTLEKDLFLYEKPILKSRIKVCGLRHFFSEKMISLEEFSSNLPAFFAFSGIGDAENFIQTLQKSGLSVQGERHFPDHYDFQHEDITNLFSEAAKNKIDWFVSTEKDFYRLKSDDALFQLFQNKACYYLEIEFEIDEGRLVLEKSLKALTLPRHAQP
ncbi:tetraacyldisaccharide 4'-kinase [Chloroherpeton thalassium ATCC 35110]|uniref:Tetraacyldisaccharide 4'-kinase n=1 Tax=Chloroherpeton thalassium (strain ATCC 35110 / GB-78) TaxID=517418 RepID=B3QSJ9_CHLT3|nr:tetraacyldisaccharide 4'-kinase [Chloroherpeton thalassium]ACF14046.1 tetraacyldisaccharide 4'-kinase [Chloroherpeton thalassium ATCC 35110]